MKWRYFLCEDMVIVSILKIQEVSILQIQGSHPSLVMKEGKYR